MAPEHQNDSYYEEGQRREHRTTPPPPIAKLKAGSKQPLADARGSVSGVESETAF